MEENQQQQGKALTYVGPTHSLDFLNLEQKMRKKTRKERKAMPGRRRILHKIQIRWDWLVLGFVFIYFRNDDESLMHGLEALFSAANGSNWRFF
jgi:hypothetical protein